MSLFIELPYSAPKALSTAIGLHSGLFHGAGRGLTAYFSEHSFSSNPKLKLREHWGEVMGFELLCHPGTESFPKASSGEEATNRARQAKHGPTNRLFVFVWVEFPTISGGQVKFRAFSHYITNVTKTGNSK